MTRISLVLLFAFWIPWISSPPPLAAAEAQLPALKVSDWTTLDVYYIWKRRCRQVTSPSNVHAALTKVARKQGVQLQRLDQRPISTSDHPVFVVACTSYDLGDDWVLGATMGLERGVRYVVEDRVYRSRMFGEALTDLWRLRVGYRGSEAFVLDAVTKGMDVFLDEYREVNNAQPREATLPNVSPTDSKTGFRVEDWHRLSLLVAAECQDLFDIVSLIEEAGREYDLNVPEDFESTTASLLEAVDEPTMWIDCVYADPSDFDPFYRIDVSLVRPAAYEDGNVLRHGLVRSTPKLILGGAASVMGGLVRKDLDIEESFRRVFSSFLEKLQRANP